VLEPRFEDYAFLTPQDMAGDYFTVTIRYRLDLYSPEGERVDGYVFTGFGREKSGTLGGNTGPLSAATQRAMRDAGAKLAVELASQDTVRRLLDGDDVEPVATEAQQVQEALGSFGPPPAAPGVPAGEGEASATGAPGGSPGPEAETTGGEPARDTPPPAT
jgi:hypothetical protein